MAEEIIAKWKNTYFGLARCPSRFHPVMSPEEDFDPGCLCVSPTQDIDCDGLAVPFYIDVPITGPTTCGACTNNASFCSGADGTHRLYLNNSSVVDSPTVECTTYTYASDVAVVPSCAETTNSRLSLQVVWNPAPSTGEMRLRVFSSNAADPSPGSFGLLAEYFNGDVGTITAFDDITLSGGWGSTSCASGPCDNGPASIDVTPGPLIPNV